jgi:hypothetical protein
MFATMSVAAETATEFAVCLYDCRHEAFAQPHAVAVSFCQVCHKTTKPPVTANASIKTLRSAEEVIRFIEQKQPCLAA